MTEENPLDPAGTEQEVPAEEQEVSGQEQEQEAPRKENGDCSEKLPEKPPAPAEEAGFVHPEGGWGWVVMLSSMWCNGTVFGIQNSFGLLFVELLKRFGSENDADLRFRACESRCCMRFPSHAGDRALNHLCTAVLEQVLYDIWNSNISEFMDPLPTIRIYGNPTISENMELKNVWSSNNVKMYGTQVISEEIKP